MIKNLQVSEMFLYICVYLLKREINSMQKLYTYLILSMTLTSGWLWYTLCDGTDFSTQPRDYSYNMM